MNQQKELKMYEKALFTSNFKISSTKKEQQPTGHCSKKDILSGNPLAKMNYALFDEPNIRNVSRAVLTIAALPGAKTLRGS